MTLFPLLLGLASTTLLLATGVRARPPSPLPVPSGAAGLAMNSPWWENYDTKDRYLCSDKAGVVLERNDSQASLFSGNSRMTLFREASDEPGLIYRNEDLRLILRGDELTLERLPMKITCLRSQEV